MQQQAPCLLSKQSRYDSKFGAALCVLTDRICPRQTFASNIKKGRWSKKYKEECASCAQYVENAVTNVMRSLESQDPAEVEDVRERMNELLE